MSQQEQQQQEDPAKKLAEARTVGKRSKRNRLAKIGTLFKACPVCKACLVKPDDVEKFQGNKFYLKQHGANNDNTGYETYFCDFCGFFTCLVISKEQIKIVPTFKISPEKKAGSNPFADLFAGFAGGGNGNGGGQQCQS